VQAGLFTQYGVRRILLDVIGGAAVYVMTSFLSGREAADIMGRVEAWR
jgi:hypothetical protein